MAGRFYVNDMERPNSVLMHTKEPFTIIIISVVIRIITSLINMIINIIKPTSKKIKYSYRNVTSTSAYSIHIGRCFDNTAYARVYKINNFTQRHVCVINEEDDFGELAYNFVFPEDGFTMIRAIKYMKKYLKEQNSDLADVDWGIEYHA